MPVPDPLKVFVDALTGPENLPPQKWWDTYGTDGLDPLSRAWSESRDAQAMLDVLALCGHPLVTSAIDVASDASRHWTGWPLLRDGSAAAAAIRDLVRVPPRFDDYRRLVSHPRGTEVRVTPLGSYRGSRQVIEAADVARVHGHAPIGNKGRALLMIQARSWSRTVMATGWLSLDPAERRQRAIPLTPNVTSLAIVVYPPTWGECELVLEIGDGRWDARSKAIAEYEFTIVTE